MVNLAGYDAKIGYLVTTDAYPDTAAGANAFNQITLCNNVSLSWEPQWIGASGLGSRTRQAAVVGKVDDKVSLEYYLGDDTAATYSYNLLTYCNSETQLMFLIIIDSDRDGTFLADDTDSYLYLRGCYVNSVTISGSEGEATKVSMELSVNRIDYSATADNAANVFTAETTPTLSEYYDSDIQYGGTLDDTNADYSGSWSLTVNNNRTKKWGTADQYPYVDERGACEITGSISKDLVGFESIVDIEAGQGGLTTDTLTITVLGGANVKTAIMTGVTYDSLGIDLSENELTTQEIAFTASTITLTELT